MTRELVRPRPDASLTPVQSIELVELALTGLAKSSRDGYRKDFDAFARFAGGDVATALWDLIHLEQGNANGIALAWTAAMESAKLSPATIARRLAALKRVITRARLVGLTTIGLDVDPPKTESLRDCAGPGAAGWGKLLKQAQAEAVAGARGALRNVAIVLLLHDRALRREEVASLDQPEDLDMQTPAVQVLGKGKVAKEWLTINDRTRSALEAWCAVRGTVAGPLFTRCDSGASKPDQVPSRLLGESINRMVRSLGARSGVSRRVRAHGLRHQSITEALDAGWDVRDVKAFSRHGRIDTVLIYDDRRKDLGGEITRDLGDKKRRTPRAGK